MKSIFHRRAFALFRALADWPPCDKKLSQALRLHHNPFLDRIFMLGAFACQRSSCSPVRIAAMTGAKVAREKVRLKRHFGKVREFE
ncbi:MAG: hypothetical protein U0X75_16075 [Acidobacteriota bacterium]